ncbi:MAG: hypothetical protein Q8L13_03905, partial [Bradyrhizobium sp.]|uniref:hypothetical protein n=1 Tax=Bradyrhizobium sp. TaxID=376 RepID=UPI0027321B45
RRNAPPVGAIRGSASAAGGFPDYAAGPRIRAIRRLHPGYGTVTNDTARRAFKKFFAIPLKPNRALLLFLSPP